ncbi:LLM class flavin-dependent oxidoreductase [Agrobacterium larrymoorei]|uniref:LLM class flavin-dependent oxidoreductase n=1 Tax=Agrobacterium larrymoorei TaxID=160699 RepID=UPI001572A49B|nr:LLM class flavin-dependent oxidoreductase [Agrobacterium larrymoorei]NTJ44643.1 LLM class flavin-dependent oxidoreductase [Agrobacterium larrymoorei]
MSGASEFLWYIPNDVKAGHRGDIASADHNSLATLTSQAKALEQNGWKGALIGTGWGRPDTFTVATAIAAQTSTFEPLAAIRPGYWQPAHFASSAATLDQLSGGRLRINIVSGQDKLAAYGDSEGDQAQRYSRTKEFMRLVRLLWTEEDVTFEGQHFQVTNSTAQPRVTIREDRHHPKLYFGGASEAAEKVAATEADVQLFWGEPLQSIQERIERLKELGKRLDRDLPPLEFGLRITTLVRSTTAEAWRDAENKVAEMAKGAGARWNDHLQSVAVGQQRLYDLQHRGDVLDDNLYTAPGRVGGGGAGTTWLVGSAADVASSLEKYRQLGITSFILSDTPYLTEIERQGQQLLPLLKD